MPQIVHIALAFNDTKGTYARHAAVTMTSVFENTLSPVVFHVLHDGTLTEYNRDAFCEIARNYGQTVVFHDVAGIFLSHRAELERMEGLSHWSRGALYRLFLPELIDGDRVVYMDCDVVVTLDVSELWGVQFEDNSIAVVRDLISLKERSQVTWRQRKIWDLWKVKFGTYFNSGIIVFNLEKIRKEYDIFDSLGDFLALNRMFVMAPDQDYLNWLFADDKTFIDEKFNRMRVNETSAANLYNSVWHMMWKPWLNYAYPPVDDLYWIYLRKTPYCKDEMAFVRTALANLASSHYMHRHSVSCIRRLKQQLRESLFRVHNLSFPYLIWCLIFAPNRGYNDMRKGR